MQIEQTLLLLAGALYGALVTYSVITARLLPRARLAEKLLELERKFREEDRVRLEAALDFERQQVRSLKGFVDSLVVLHDSETKNQVSAAEQGECPYERSKDRQQRGPAGYS